ncbi:MAG TPA: SpoIIE family protein phosphatase [Tichowtungia sp.]|nr:SpoIIE family protein phosphatase [Tichowtungia sp.]
MNSEKKYSSEELLSQLLDHIDDNIYFKDRESRFILINEAFAKRLNMRPEDVIGKTDFDIFTEEHAQPAFEAEQHIIRTGEPLLGLEEKETWGNRRVTWASTTKMPLRNADGEIVGTFGMSRDITEHKLNEIQLHKYARRLTQINKQMQEELSMAANLQHAFLPQFYPDFPLCANAERCVKFAHSYIANTQISGDLCAIHKISDTKAALLIFDVMGHGVRAALITAILHTMIGDLSRRDLSPGRFLSEMNRQLRPMLQSQDSFIFVTAACLILNAKTGELRGASAGHPPPLIIQTPKGRAPEAELMHAASHLNGPALAVVENAEYKTFSLQLESGDTVLLYTDGLIEEPDKHAEEFGIENVSKTIAAQEGNEPKAVCQALVDAVQNFNDHEQLSDDVCLLAFRWNGCFECDWPPPAN